MANLKKRQTVVPLKDRTAEELLLEQARESLRKYGSLVPPREALLSVTRATCPKCGHEGPLMEDFGLRTVNGEARPQSWCRTCRSGSDAHPTRQKNGRVRR